MRMIHYKSLLPVPVTKKVIGLLVTFSRETLALIMIRIRDANEDESTDNIPIQSDLYNP